MLKITIVLWALWATAFCNIWDNLISGMAAPHVYFPDNFDVVVSTNSTINNTYYMAFDSVGNHIHIQGNYSFLDFKPKTFIDIYVNLKQKNISMVQENMCQFFAIPTNNTLPVFAKIFATIPLITYYTGVKDNIYHQYLFANPLGESTDSSKFTLVFKEVELEKGAKDYPFDKFVIQKFQKDLPVPLELVVLEKVKKRTFKPEDFIPTVKCQPPTEEVQKYFLEIYNMILKWIQDMS